MNKFLHLDDNNSQFYVIDSFRSMKCEIDTGVYLLDFFAPALCTVEFALSPFYILIYMFWRWCIDKLGVLHANQTSMCLDPYLN